MSKAIHYKHINTDNSPLRLTTKKTSQLHITDTLGEESTGDWRKHACWQHFKNIFFKKNCFKFIDALGAWV